MALSALGAGLSPAAEQNPPSDGEEPPADSSSSSPYRLGPVTVTARKRAEDLQEIGVSASTLYGETLTERRLDTIHAVAETIPNVSVFEVFGGGVPVLIIRGVGPQDYRINNTPTAAFYVDGVYQTSIAMSDAMLFDLERIEVLKGPQGGLYGRNTTGGAVQVISRKPDFGPASGYASYGMGRYMTQEIEGAFGAPLGEDWAMRVAARSVTSDDTWSKSVATGKRHGEKDRWAAKALLGWRPGEDLEALFKVHGGADRSELPLLRTFGTWEPGATIAPGVADGIVLNFGGIDPSLDHLCAPLLAGRRDNSRCASEDGRTPASKGLGADVHDTLSSNLDALGHDWWGASARFDWPLGNLVATSISAYDDFDYGRDLDADGLIEVYEDVYLTSTIEAWSQEFRLTSAEDQALPWILGITLAGDRFTEETVLRADHGLVPLGFGGANRVLLDYTQDTRSYAAYGQVSWPFREGWTLLVELRYTYETKAFEGGTFFPEANFPDTETDADQTFDDFSGKIGLEWHFAPEQLLYASLSRGFKSGGFFGGFVADPAQLEPYESETILAWELGYKADIAQLVRLSAAAFLYDFDDFQGFAQVRSGAAVIPRLTNLGEARIAGAEAAITWVPGPGWYFDLGVGYLDGEITDSDFEASDSFSVGLHPVEHSRLPNYSDWTANALARYSFPLGTKRYLTPQIEWRYASAKDFAFIATPPERPIFREEGYSVTNLRLFLESPESGWTLSAWIENAFDETYRMTARPDAIGGMYELYAGPRTYGFGFRYRFE